jgi:hypothetical protein
MFKVIKKTIRVSMVNRKMPRAATKVDQYLLQYLNISSVLELERVAEKEAAQLVEDTRSTYESWSKFVEECRNKTGFFASKGL